MLWCFLFGRFLLEPARNSLTDFAGSARDRTKKTEAYFSTPLGLFLWKLAICEREKDKCLRVINSVWPSSVAAPLTFKADRLSRLVPQLVSDKVRESF